MLWSDQFPTLFDRCCGFYRGGNRDFTTYYGPDDAAFLASIGHQPREFFDFIEDYCDEGHPSPATALLVASVRRDYFLVVQNGRFADGPKLGRDDVPTFGEDFEGLAYLPRILAKAQAKLEGRLDPDLMFGCGGDRNFLRKHGNLHPADFLRRVWAADGDAHELLAWIRSHTP